MAPKCHEFAVVLQRDGPKTQWGIRLVGGSDLNTPLIVTKVTSFNCLIVFMLYFLSNNCSQGFCGNYQVDQFNVNDCFKIVNESLVAIM